MTYGCARNPGVDIYWAVSMVHSNIVTSVAAFETEKDDIFVTERFETVTDLFDDLKRNKLVIDTLPHKYPVHQDWEEDMSNWHHVVSNGKVVEWSASHFSHVHFNADALDSFEQCFKANPWDLLSLQDILSHVFLVSL